MAFLGEATWHQGGGLLPQAGGDTFNPVSWWAFVDESMRETDADSIYVLAAAVIDPVDASAARQLLRGLVDRRQRIHWKDAEPHERRKIVQTVADLAALHVVIVGAPMGTQERARRKCLERLLWELHDHGVAEVCLESRTERLNRDDFSLVDRWRRYGKVAGDLRLSFGLPRGPKVEPLLWLPDVVAGAVNAAHFGDDQYLVPLEGLVTYHRLELD